MNKRLNLYKEYNNRKRSQGTSQKKRGYTLIMSAIILILGALILKFYLDNKSLEAENRAMQAYINDPTVQSDYAAFTESQESLNTMNDLKDKLDDVNGVLDNKHTIKASVLELVYAAAPTNTTITSVEISNGVMTVVFSSSSLDEPALFARNLEASLLLNEVNYSGHQQTGETYDGVIIASLEGSY